MSHGLAPPLARSEAGLALLSALLSVALLSVIVIEFADTSLVHAHLSRNAGNALAAQLLARSAVVGAEALLIEDLKQNPKVTSLEDPWSFPLALPTRNGSVAFQITDERGKLDLNQVRNAKVRAALESLFADLDVDVRLLDAVEAWTQKLEAASEGAGAGLCTLSIPCEPRHAELQGLDELRMIRGFDDEVIRKIRDYVTALPRSATQRASGVNVNTADPRVLRALGCKIDDERPPGGYSALKDACPDGDTSALSLRSDVFSIEAIGTVGDVSQRVRATVSRGGSSVTRLAWRERPVSDSTPREVP